MQKKQYESVDEYDDAFMFVFGAVIVVLVLWGISAPSFQQTDPYPYTEAMCDSDAECVEATGYPISEAMAENPEKYPRLVGIGCIGTNGDPIYAFEEDDFPEAGCRAIWEMDWDWRENIES